MAGRATERPITKRRYTRCWCSEGETGFEAMTLALCEDTWGRRYVMKQKVFTLGDKFTIRNEQGEDAFFVDGQVFSIGHKLSFEDAQGKELMFIRQKVFSLGPTYEIYRGEEHVATIKK